MAKTPKRVGILLFPEVELLDFAGPYEVFAATRLREQRRREEPSPFEIHLIAEQEIPLVTAAGLRVLPDATLVTCPQLDLLVVPGGWGTRWQLLNQRLTAWIAQTGRQVETLTSVCTGALLLARAGLLDGRHATTHWGALEFMRESFPAVKVESRFRVVEDGNILTSAGISAGIDMALRVVARYFGRAVALATARHIEYEIRRGSCSTIRRR